MTKTMRSAGLAMPILALALFGCVQPQLRQTKTFDAETMRSVKKVAIMPFFYPSGMTVDDPGYTGEYADMMFTVNVFKGISGNKRFDIVPLDKTAAALKSAGFEGVKLAPGEKVSMMKAAFSPEKYRVGMTMQQALAAGKTLDVDAVLMGAYGYVMDKGPGGMKAMMTMRLVDPKTGKVLWGAAKSEPMKVSIFSPFKSQQEQIQRLAAAVIGEAQ
jgi:hypothetical protein